MRIQQRSPEGLGDARQLAPPFTGTAQLSGFDLKLNDARRRTLEFVVTDDRALRANRGAVS